MFVVADIVRDAAFRHHAGVAMSSHREPMREAHAVLLVETSGDQQHRFGIRSPWTCVQGNTEVDGL